MSDVDKAWPRIATLLMLLIAAAGVPAAEEHASSVVFICERGSVKSLMAAHLFEASAKQHGLALRGVARGITPDARVPSRIADALHSEGIDVARFQPQRFDRAEVANAVRVIAIGIEPWKLGVTSNVETWDDIPSSENYSAARAALQRRIDELVDSLRER